MLLELRGGEDYISEFIIKVILVWALGQTSKPTEGFQIKPTNPHLGRAGQRQPNPRVVPKLLENPADRNNMGQESCKSSQHPSLDTMSNFLTQEYSEFQNKYYPESSPKRFDTMSVRLQNLKN